MHLVGILQHHFLSRAFLSVYFVQNGKGAIVKINVSQGRGRSPFEMRISQACCVDIGKADIVDPSAPHALVILNLHEDRMLVYLVHHDRIENNILDTCLLSAHIGGNRIFDVKSSYVPALSNFEREMNADTEERLGNDDIRKHTVADLTVIDPADTDAICVAGQRAVGDADSLARRIFFQRNAVCPDDDTIISTGDKAV